VLNVSRGLNELINLQGEEVGGILEVQGLLRSYQKRQYALRK
jgi:hypothetical protein